MQEHHAKDFIPSKDADKATRYANVKLAFQERLDENSHPLSNTSNLIAILMQEFSWWWVGFYWVKAKNTALEHLALGQFQGPPACTKLFKGTGVCAWAWVNKQSIVLADVEKFEGHVACSSVSKSEIVIPIFQDGQVIGVLDIDGATLGLFDETDEQSLRELLEEINKIGHFKWFAQNI